MPPRKRASATRRRGEELHRAKYGGAYGSKGKCPARRGKGSKSYGCIQSAGHSGPHVSFAGGKKHTWK